MEQTTITEKLIVSFNKFSQNRDPESLGAAVREVINLFNKKVSKGMVNQETITDFSDMVTMYKYTDTPEISQEITMYYQESLKNSLEQSEITMSSMSQELQGRRIA